MVCRVLIAILSFAAAAGACAHRAPQPDPYVEKGVAGMRAWLDRIPRCSPLQQKQRMASLGGASGDSADAVIIAVRGQLTLATIRSCTAMMCPDSCCNTCFPNWVVIPNEGDRAGKELNIQRTGELHALGAGVMDCHLDEMRRRLPRTEVLVSGFVERDQFRDIIVEASLCVIPPPPAPAP